MHAVYHAAISCVPRSFRAPAPVDSLCGRAAQAERPKRSSFVASLDVDLLIHRAFLRTMPHAIQRPRIAVRARHSVVGRVVGRVLVAGGKADSRGLYRPTDAGKLPHTSALCRPIESSGNA